MYRRETPWDIVKPLLFFLGSILWLEGIYRAFYVRPFFDVGLVYILLFSLPLAGMCALLTSLWGKKGNRKAGFAVLGVLTLWYMIQSVYHTIFATVLVTKSFNMAGQALGSYWKETLLGIWEALPALLLLAVPLVVYFFQPRFALLNRPDGRVLLGVIGGVIIVQAAAVLAIALPTGGIMTTRQIYRETFVPDLTVSHFGLATTLRLDIEQTLFGLEEPSRPDPGEGSVSTLAPGNVSVQPEEPEEGETPAASGPNVMDIDFDALIANETDSTLKDMHEYFRDRTPTEKNQYTGMFQGKNLLLFTGEAFWIGAVNEQYTPTLYKLAHSGFVFENFYNPLWYYSTVDGEYAATTGLIPTNQVNASQRYAGKNGVSMYFSMGNQLRALGYPTLAYHNNTANYYDRNLSHPNLGYDFYACDTGLDVAMTWPQSDLEMMQLTLPQALAGEKPFHNYYMTVSGHMNYSFAGNAMSAKHRDEVADLDMSEAARAYLACNMELDQALEYTIKTLEEAGELENTVIVLSGDHYPYGLDGTGAIDELAGEGTEADPFEKYRSTLILWSGDMEEPVVVDKPCYSVDIIPTLSNLFGLEYDSRLLAGRDILSDAPGLVIFNDYSYLTELGRYNADTDTFTPNEGAQVPENYAQDTYWEARYIRSYSEKILFNDYYRKIGLEPPAGPEEN
ncbi:MULTISPECIES: LTA synthase family protein [Eubacteriales]|jgi:lipoteichoic acid synthase|uniref:LTA synthase family protein n=1 Tax=Eubacteriales TaxID=186802 RepID=UPI00067EC543|nr:MULTISPECIES: LTA synthase family protein [Eubacteriales]MBS5506812.1 LTA synthase family protein [Oscillospiraceae bacterium]MCB5927558.1 LTA synthase family protein [bacterium 210820-DFI.5.26]MCQ5160493.1 LTA synthase family protein [Clostridium sp. DFI.5.61]UMM47801.1 LTA synthase family protein [Lawsonibacter asaccharolyticus]